MQHDEIWGISCLSNFQQLQFRVLSKYCLRLVVVGDEFDYVANLPYEFINPWNFIAILF
jgi:hypothetical protein